MGSFLLEDSFISPGGPFKRLLQPSRGVRQPLSPVCVGGGGRSKAGPGVFRKGASAGHTVHLGWVSALPGPGLAWPIGGRRLRRRGGAASGLSLCSWSLSRHHTCAVSTAWPPCAHLLWPHPESRGGLWPERCAQGSPSARCFLALSLTLLSPGVVSVPGLCAAVSFSQGGLRAGVRSLLRSPPAPGDEPPISGCVPTRGRQTGRPRRREF